MAFAAAATLAAIVLGLSGSLVFARYLGPVPPVAALLGTAGAGYLALTSLRRGGWMRGRSTLAPRGIFRLALYATGFAALTVLSDIAAPYPRGINVPLPAAALFYPAIGFLAEIVLHLVPLALLLGLSSRLGLAKRPALFIALALTAALEPAFQIAPGPDVGPLWRDVFLGATLFAFALVQLACLLRYGFAAMLGLRLIYYLFWHVLWGAARLEVLF